MSASQLGSRRPGHVQHEQLRRQHLYRPHSGGGPVRGIRPGLRDLRLRAQRVTRPGHRPAPGQVQRHGRTHLAAGRHQVHGHRRDRGPDDRSRHPPRGRAAQRYRTAGVPGARADHARTDAAGQLAVLVLRARSRQSGLPERHGVDGDADSRPGAAAGHRPRKRVLVRLRLGCRGGRRRGHRPPAGPRRAPAVGGVGMGVPSSRSRAALPSGGNGQQRGGPAPQLRRRSSWDWRRSATSRPPPR